MNLKELSGLSMQLDVNGKLHFSPEIVVDEYRSRKLNELTSVYLDEQACQGDQIAYEMFNGIYDQSDQGRLDGLPVRYELTLFPDTRVGKEFIKTLGHIHQPEIQSGIDHPEICEVLVGRAHFFFMKLDPVGMAAEEAFFIEVGAGQKLIIPPGYDHLTINPGPGPMLFSDVVSRSVKGNYERMKSAHGAAYLEIERDGKAEFIPNTHHHSHPPLKQMQAKEFPSIGLQINKPLYEAFIETRAQDWEFLWKPALFHAKFPNPQATFSPIG